LRWAQSSRSEGMMIEDVLATGETGGEEPLRPRAIIIPGGARERARESTGPRGRCAHIWMRRPQGDGISLTYMVCGKVDRRMVGEH
jgi:hypothetical protein